MRVIHLSYARIQGISDPHAWLKTINFFAALAEQMARDVEVKSIHCINYSGVLNRNKVEYHFVKRSKFKLWFPFSLHRYVRRLGPDVIIVHGLTFPWQVLCLRWQLGGGVKIAIQHHSEIPLRHYKKLLQHIVDRFVPAYFFPSKDQAQHWVEQGQIRSIDKVYEIMEVPSVFYTIDKDEAKMKTKVSGKLIYLWVGRFDANKDPLTLVSGFLSFAKLNSNAILYVVYQRNELIEEVTSLLKRSPEAAGRIFLVGKVAHEELLYWFNSADFIISTSHYEGMGVAISEAMSCGCIPILTRIPSFKAMTGQGKCGLLFKAGDAGDLTEKLNQSVAMNLSKEREAVLCQYEEHLSAKAISDNMLTAIKEIMK